MRPAASSPDLPRRFRWLSHRGLLGCQLPQITVTPNTDREHGCPARRGQEGPGTTGPWGRLPGLHTCRQGPFSACFSLLVWAEPRAVPASSRVGSGGQHGPCRGQGGLPAALWSRHAGVVRARRPVMPRPVRLERGCGGAGPAGRSGFASMSRDSALPQLAVVTAERQRGGLAGRPTREPGESAHGERSLHRQGAECPEVGRLQARLAPEAQECHRGPGSSLLAPPKDQRPSGPQGGHPGPSGDTGLHHHEESVPSQCPHVLRGAVTTQLGPHGSP